MKMRLLIALVAVVSWICVSAVAAAAQGAKMTVVASGLDNPRDLAFAWGGALYVAEAGHGGADCLSSPEFGKVCIGFTSKISLVDVAHHRVHRVVTGLYSTASEDGSAATGIDGISVLGRDQIFGIFTGARLAIPSGVLPETTTQRAKRQAGRLIVASTNGSWHVVANVGDRDWRWSLHHMGLVPGQFPDANPYGVYAGGRSRWVVDAATNTIDRIGADGRVHIVQFIPNPSASDAVPTCIDRGPDGAFYVGELTGGGNGPGAARVWRYSPGEDRLSLWASGLTAVTGCGFGRDGRFYATEFSTVGLENAAPGTGRVVRVPPHSTSPVTVVDGLSFPGGFAAGRHAVYVSNWSIAPAHNGGGPTGSVVRIEIDS
jgi:hypothetical protein